MRYLLVLTLVSYTRAAVAQNAPQTPAACEKLASLSLPNTSDRAGTGGERGRVHRARESGGTRRRRIVCTGGHDRSCAGRAWKSDGQHGRLGPWLQRRARHPAFQCASSLLPRRSDLEALGVLRDSHGNVDADHRLEWPLSWHQPQRSGRVINYNAMGVGLSDGFAIASSDMGHQGGDTAWMQVPDKVTDFAGRAMHETTVAGKALDDRLLRDRDHSTPHDRVRRRLGRGPARSSESTPPITTASSLAATLLI